MRAAPARLEELPPALLPPVLGAVAAARHDLGKYMAMSLRWLPADPPVEELRAALVADLAATRRQGDQVEDAPHLWARLRGPLVGEVALEDETHVDLSADPDFVEVDRGMATLAAALPGLATAPAAELAVLASTALAVSNALSRLHRRLRALQA